jgi:scyllo-inosamine 4-kinase
MQHLKAIASGIFARHGVDFATAKRAGGWSNATWLAGGLALRMAVAQDRDDIRREAKIAALLPPEVGYPPLVETGVTAGYEWSLSKEIPGRNLGAVWPELDGSARIEALRQLWEKTLAVHSVDVSAAAGLARKQAWFNATDAGEAAATLDRLARQGHFTAPRAKILGGMLDRFWQARRSAPCVLNHGDLTLDNALWHHGRVVCLLDFEFAVMAPAELDLNSLVNLAYAPGDEHDALSDPCREEMRQAAAEVAGPVLDHPGGVDLLYGYAVLLDLWRFKDWLAHPEGEGPMQEWAPYVNLLSLADGQGGYLAAIL